MPSGNQSFAVVLASPPEYNELTAEIFFDGKFVALISHERDPGLFDIEIPGIDPVEESIARKVELSGFLSAIDAACKRLRGEEG